MNMSEIQIINKIQKKKREKEKANLMNKTLNISIKEKKQYKN